MGVYIYMDMLPNEIDRAKWESVYEESLELIRAYPFLGHIIDRDTYGVPWVYGVRGDEIELGKDQKGWHVFGEYKTMHGAESFILYRDIEHYRKRNPLREGCPDILADWMNWYVFYDQEERQIPIDSVSVFDSKTQGTPYHNYILAIACLFESRFPEQVIVRGDISIGQMNKAIEWANTILQKPIQLTERADNEKLIKRISRIVGDEYGALTAFMALNMQGGDFALGELIRKQYSDETIKAYFTEKFKQYDVSTIGFRSSLSSFCNMGFSVEKACEICVLDREGCQYDAQEFAETVLSLEWNDGKIRIDDDLIAYNRPEGEEPETVYSQFGKTFFQMAGFQESMKSTMSSEEVKHILENKLGELVELKIIKESEYEEAEQKESTHRESEPEESDNDNKETIQDLLSQLMNEYKEELETHSPKYVISDIDDLILWEPGDSLDPEIEKQLMKLKEFTTEMIEEHKDIFDQFNKESEYDKMRKLILANRHFLIRKDFWGYYMEHLNERNVINRVLSILNIKADEINLNRLCKSVLNNRNLLEKFIL
ncbi:hypothetical protein [Oceanobacillus sp. FSL W7-1293]|uniref:hypothetical protein n=1 Tax=Oceanobacillus sp. FSL W7-1293 TaxID=2921699 RepID=UPI0030D5480B